MNKPSLITFAAVLFVLLSACSGTTRREYSAGAIDSFVMDSDSGLPLEAVNVVASWSLGRGWHTGMGHKGEIMVLETVTDHKGHFHFPAWGPVEVTGKGGSQGVELVFFKPGYGESSDAFYDVKYLSDAKELWDEQLWAGFRLDRLDGKQEDAERNLNWLQSDLRFMDYACNWRKIPRLLLVVEKEYERLDKEYGIGRGGASLDLTKSNQKVQDWYAKDCGVTPKEFLLEYKQRQESETHD